MCVLPKPSLVAFSNLDLQQFSENVQKRSSGLQKNFVLSIGTFGKCTEMQKDCNYTLDGLIYKAVLQAAIILVAMASEKNIWQLKF